MQLLRVDKERLNGSLQEMQEQFARLKLEFKKEVANATPTTPPTEPPMPNQVPLFFTHKYDRAHIHTHTLTKLIFHQNRKNSFVIFVCTVCQTSCNEPGTSSGDGEGQE